MEKVGVPSRGGNGADTVNLALHLCSFAIGQLLSGACQAVGVAGGEQAASAVTAFLRQHFTAHSARLDRALRTELTPAERILWRPLRLFAYNSNSSRIRR